MMLFGWVKIFFTETPQEMTRNLRQIQAMIPFAVVGSERNIIVNGQPVRGRKNKWGVINVENEEHVRCPSYRKASSLPYSLAFQLVYAFMQCEFNYLRNFLTRTHLQDLIETTSGVCLIFL